jgi:hypothetical protein
MITLAFYKGKGTWVDRVIRFVTRSNYSHVEVIYSYDHDTLRGCTVSASSRDGGVRATVIAFNPEHWDFLPVPWITHEHVRARAFPELHKPYDYIGLMLSQLFNFHRGGRGWFCSELAAYIIGLPLPSSWSPGELKDVLEYYASIGGSSKPNQL